MLWGGPAVRMHVTKIQVGHDILILGDAETLRGLPRDLRRRSAVCGVLRRMMTDAHAMRQLRQYWGSRSLSQPDGRRTDHELIEVIEAAVESGAVPAMVMPDLGPHVRHLGAGVADTGWRPPVSARPVAQMTAEERIWAVVTRAAADLPRATGDALLALFTPENIAIAAGLAGLSAAANLTPLGWAADGVMIAVAVGFGGMAAIQGVKDLVQCFYLTVNATRDGALDAAAEHLARVVAEFGVPWLMALLRERAARGIAGGEGEAKDEIISPYMVEKRTSRSSAVILDGPGSRIVSNASAALVKVSSSIASEIKQHPEALGAAVTAAGVAIAVAAEIASLGADTPALPAEIGAAVEAGTAATEAIESASVAEGTSIAESADAVEAANASSTEAKGGTYVLRDGDEIVRSGRTNDFARRQAEHARDPELSQYNFEPAHSTDNYAEQRGLEQMLHDQFEPPLNKIKPISPKNRNLAKYLEAAKDYIRRRGGL